MQSYDGFWGDIASSPAISGNTKDCSYALMRVHTQ